MKLLVGLGNPGREYVAHRHNVGFRVIEAVAAAARISLDQARFHGRFGSGLWQGEPVALMLPETFMNRSGTAVSAALEALPLADPDRDLIVVYDDADLPLGRLRLRARGSDGGQKGVRDILERTGRAVPRLRFGIGRPATPQDTRAFVLEAFSPEEAAPLAGAIDRAVSALACWVVEGIEPAMNRFNASATPAENEGAP